MLAAIAALLGSCGGSSSTLPPAAEPAHSPPLTEAPAGRVVSPGAPAARSRPAPARHGGVAATTDGRYFGVVGVRARVLRVYDARTRREVAETHVGVGPTHVVAFRRRFFVVDTRGNGLVEVRMRGGELVVHRRTHLQGAPYGIAFDSERGRFWVTLTARNRVAELTDRRLLRSFPTVRQPNSVAVDPPSGRVYVASRLDGRIQLLDPPPR